MNTLPPSGTIKALQALAESIRTAGSIPSGQLYAACLNFCTLEVYQQLIDILKRAGLVKESGGHVLTWIEPEPRMTQTNERTGEYTEDTPEQTRTKKITQEARSL